MAATHHEEEDSVNLFSPSVVSSFIVELDALAISMLEIRRRGALVGEVDDGLDDFPLGKSEVASERSEVDLEEARGRRGLVAQHSAQSDLGLEEVRSEGKHEAMRQNSGAVLAPDKG